MDVSKFKLVPKHTKLSESDKKKLLEKFTISSKQLPKILIEDVAIQALKPKVGDVIKIERVSVTSGISYYYRVVINE
jgi:DNA-directed RNA polymerases I, II, and III subunit RPABC1